MYGKNIRIKSFVAAAVFSAVFIGPGGMNALDVSVNGSAKSVTGWFVDESEANRGLSDTVLRLNAALYPAEFLSVETAYVLTQRIGPHSSSEGILGTPYAGYRLWEPEDLLLPREAGEDDTIGLYQDMDRLSVTFRLPLFDLYVGRQAIAWGSAKLINPTDIFALFAFTSLDNEYRRGVDALRLRVPLGLQNEADFGYVAGEKFRMKESAAFGRLRLYVLETDATFSCVYFKENLMAGLDIARALGDAGVWLEAAWTFPGLGGDLSTWRDSPNGSYAVLSAGADINLFNDWYAYGEYHFNSPGGGDPDDYLDLVMDSEKHPAYGEGNVYLLGRHYINLGGSYMGFALMPVSFLLMINLNDFSMDFSISAEYNIKEDIYIEGGVFLGIGEELDSDNGIPLRYRSEFGAYPDVFYIAAKVYF